VEFLCNLNFGTGDRQTLTYKDFLREKIEIMLPDVGYSGNNQRFAEML